MDVRIQFTDQKICGSNPATTDGAGAVVEFLGVVRDVERDAKISGLVYEIYEPMADRMVRRIVEELDANYPCLTFHLFIDMVSCRSARRPSMLRIEASHRTEAIRMLEHFMNRLKTDVPIWKSGFVPC